jgi:type III pantothenate kinase
MVLCLHAGNTRIYGGLFDGDRLHLQFHKISRRRVSADEFGVFLLNVLAARQLTPASVERISLCSVVPEATTALRQACEMYVGVAPFILQPGVRTGMKISYRNPLEVGSDRIAHAIAALHGYPGRDIIVVSFGTATTFCTLRRDKTYLGGAIMPGMRICQEALVGSAARLSSVEITPPETPVGRSTAESVQAGLYYGQIGMTREMITRIGENAFAGSRPFVIATGEFAGLFEAEGLFDIVIPELVLRGLYLALLMNEGR